MRMICIAAALAALSATASVTIEQDIETSEARTRYLDVFRGETVELELTMLSYGIPAKIADGTPAVICWQTNGMASAWWQRPATVTNGLVRAVITPDMDPGANRWTLFVGVGVGLNYRANYTVRVQGGPGADPQVLPLPTPLIDFARVSVTNAASAPFALRGQGGAVSSVNSQTGAVVLTAANITMADGDRVVEVELNNAMTAAMNAQGQAALAEQTANGAMAAAVTAQATADGKLAATWATGYAAAAVIYAAGTYPIVDESGASVTIENHRRTSVTASGAVSLSIDRTAGDFDAVLVLDIQAGATISWVGVTNGLSVFQPKGGKALEYEAGKKYLIGITRIGYNAIAISKQELETL